MRPDPKGSGYLFVAKRRVRRISRVGVLFEGLEHDVLGEDLGQDVGVGVGAGGIDDVGGDAAALDGGELLLVISGSYWVQSALAGGWTLSSRSFRSTSAERRTVASLNLQLRHQSAVKSTKTGLPEARAAWKVVGE